MVFNVDWLHWVRHPIDRYLSLATIYWATFIRLIEGLWHTGLYKYRNRENIRIHVTCNTIGIYHLDTAQKEQRKQKRERELDGHNAYRNFQTYCCSQIGLVLSFGYKFVLFNLSLPSDICVNRRTTKNLLALFFVFWDLLLTIVELMMKHIRMTSLRLWALRDMTSFTTLNSPWCQRIEVGQLFMQNNFFSAQRSSLHNTKFQFINGLMRWLTY